MKKLLILNALILSGLTLYAQNLVNNEDNQYASNVQVGNYTTTLTNITPQTNIGNYNNTNIQSMNRGGRGNTSALSNIKVNEVQLQTSNKPKQQKKVQVQIKTNPVVNDINYINESNNTADRGGNLWVNDNVTNSNPQANINKTTTTKIVVMEEFKGTDFKPIGLSGRDYSNGGKMKKGVKNFPKIDHSKAKHKKKPGYKKVKYHTSKCASW